MAALVFVEVEELEEPDLVLDLEPDFEDEPEEEPEEPEPEEPVWIEPTTVPKPETPADLNTAEQVEAVRADWMEAEPEKSQASLAES